MPGDTLHLLSLSIQNNVATIGWAFFTFALGSVAGFQALVARYSREYAMAILTFPGLAYLCIRGSLPAILYVACHSAQIVSLRPWQEALLLGFGSEAFLRSRILVGFKVAGPNQLPTEATGGPLDFVKWIQDFFLTRTGKVLTRRRMARVKRWYGECKLPFSEVSSRLENELAALGEEGEKERRDAAALLATSLAEYEQVLAALVPPETLSDGMERTCRLKLGYALYYALDINSFNAISKEITGH